MISGFPAENVSQGSRVRFDDGLGGGLPLELKWENWRKHGEYR